MDNSTIITSNVTIYSPCHPIFMGPGVGIPSAGSAAKRSGCSTLQPYQSLDKPLKERALLQPVTHSTSETDEEKTTSQTFGKL